MIWPVLGSVDPRGTALKLLDWIGKVDVVKAIEALGAELDVL